MQAIDVANYVLYRAAELGDRITHLKLQKLCYYSQGFHLGLGGDPLFPGALRAWAHGPVSYEVWREYRYSGDVLPAPANIDLGRFGENDRALIDLVYDRFRSYTAGQMVDMTHREAPWKEAWYALKQGGSDEISQATMRELFANRLVELDNSEAPPPLGREEVRRIVAADGELVAQTRAGYAAIAE